MIIWESTLDDRYFCKVSRVDETMGTLTVTDKSANNMLISTPVMLSYGAVFGPDVEDIARWEEICIKTVDAL